MASSHPSEKRSRPSEKRSRPSEKRSRPSGRPSPPEYKPPVIPESLKAISNQLDEAGKAYHDALRGDEKELAASLKAKLQELIYDSHKVGLEAAATDPDFPADVKARLDWSIDHAKKHETASAEEKAKPHILGGYYSTNVTIDNHTDELFRNCGGWDVPHGSFTTPAVGDINGGDLVWICMTGSWLSGIQCTCYFMMDDQDIYRWFYWAKPTDVHDDFDYDCGDEGEMYNHYAPDTNWIIFDVYS